MNQVVHNMSLRHIPVFDKQRTNVTNEQNSIPVRGLTNNSEQSNDLGVRQSHYHFPAWIVLA